ncbi:MAG: amino acid--tRNA ligase-related protein [Patescibacteria group bacterium]
MIEIGTGKKVHGWVHIRRDHGKIIFIDLRTADGLLQCVITPQFSDAHAIGSTLRSEWVVEIEGDIKERPERMKNAEQALGHIEMEVHMITVINESLTPPFDIDSDGALINEELRLQYRYLDLRRERMRNNLRHRDAVISYFRNYLHNQGFIEIETPLLSKSTPEGARDYLVPNRKEPGTFYALPQSPQQYKQLLMVAGVEKYFQFAKCLRDEDTRADRQPEFTQLDIEMSFIDREAVMQLIEGMMTTMVQQYYPDAVMQTPWPRITYSEAMEKYQSDKPDIRKDKNNLHELGFVWIIDCPLFETAMVDGHYAPSHHMFTMPKTEDIPLLDTRPGEARSYQYDLALNGYEVLGGSIRIHDPKLQARIFDLIGFSDEEKKYFSHMLRAFDYGVPPHGGAALGMDRLLAVLQRESSIREVIPFPKTGEGYDPMMDTPASVAPEQLRELGISIKKSSA